MPSLKHRSIQKEALDNLDLSGTQLDICLQQLGFINKYLGNTHSIIKLLENLTLKNGFQNTRILDLGCGGGDILIELEKKFKRMGISCQLTGIDGNPHALKYAKSKAGKDSQIAFICKDILRDNFQLPPCDILLSSHFVYHFEENQLINFLRKHKKNIHLSIVFSELRRSKFAFLLFRIFSKLLRFSSIVREDGLLAIQRAYTHKEIRSLFDKAGFTNFDIRNKRFYRMLIHLNPSNL